MIIPRLLKTEYMVLLLAIVFWISDFLIDLHIFLDNNDSHVFDLSKGVILHALVFSAQLLFILFVWKVVRETRTLKESLEAAKLATDKEAENVHSIIEGMADPVSVQNTGFLILYQNQAHQDLMGYHVGELCYRAYNNREEVCDGCHLAKTFSDGTSHRKELSLISNSQQFEIEIRSSPLRDAEGTIIAGIEVLHDITKRKKDEEDIRRLNDDLERRALDLSASYRELEAFSYSVSHDLRAPLTRIYSAAQLLDEQYRDQLNDEGRFFVRTICESGEHMEELIEALMDLAKVTSSDISCEPVDLASIAVGIIADLQNSEPDRNVSFSAPAEMIVAGDRQLLTVLMENLLGNAWKYTAKTAHASIELGMETAEGNCFYFVRDNGAGFDMNDVENLFKPFRRLHEASDFPGTGIGLATVQRIVQRHGGSVRAVGEINGGATFYFSLRQPPHHSPLPVAILQGKML